MGKKLPVGQLAAAALAMGATFLPWASFQGLYPVIDEGGRAAAGAAGYRAISVSVNGWNGHLGVAGVNVPHWMAAAAALWIAALAVRERLTGVLETRPLRAALAAYALLHTGGMLLLCALGVARARPGLYLALAAALWMAALFFLEGRGRPGDAGEAAAARPGRP